MEHSSKRRSVLVCLSAAIALLMLFAAWKLRGAPSGPVETPVVLGGRIDAVEGGSSAAPSLVGLPAARSPAGRNDFKNQSQGGGGGGDALPAAIAYLSGTVRVTGQGADDGSDDAGLSGQATVHLWHGSLDEVRQLRPAPAQSVQLSESQGGVYPFALECPAGAFVLSASTAESAESSSVLYGRVGEDDPVEGLEIRVRPGETPITGRIVGENLPAPEAIFVKALPAKWARVEKGRSSDTSIVSRESLGAYLTPDENYAFEVSRGTAETWRLYYGAHGRTHGSVTVEASDAEVELALDPMLELLLSVRSTGEGDLVSPQVIAIQSKQREAAALLDGLARFRGLHPEEPFAIIAWAEGCPPTAHVYDSVEEAQGATLRLAPGESLHGRVLDQAGEPLENARVFLEVEDTLSPPIVRAPMDVFSLADRSTAQADTEGRFRFDSLPYGEYQLRVVPNGIAREKTFSGLVTGDAPHVLTLDDPPSGELVIRAVDRSTGNAVEPINLLMVPSQAKAGESTSSVTQGFNYRLARDQVTEVAAGSYWLQLTASGFGSISMEANVPAGQRTELAVDLRPTVSARFQMLDDRQRPIPKLRFQLGREDGALIRSRTDPSGDPTTAVFRTDGQGAVQRHEIPPGWCQVLPIADPRHRMTLGVDSFEPAWFWVPDTQAPEVTCILRGVQPDEPRERRIRMLVSSEGPFDSGTVAPVLDPTTLPAAKPSDGKVTFEVRQAGGELFSTTTLERRAGKTEVRFTSDLANGPTSGAITLGLEVVTLILPGDMDNVQLTINSPEGSAVVPIGPAAKPDGPPMLLLLQ